MELLIIKLIGFLIAAVGSFLIATCVFFVTPYAFFAIPYVLLPNGFWKSRCGDGLKLIWKAHKALIRLPYTIVTLGEGKKK